MVLTYNVLCRPCGVLSQLMPVLWAFPSDSDGKESVHSAGV